VIEAPNGVEALAGIKANAVDLLVADVVMPRMSGMELTQAIRSLCPDLRVLLVSGYEETVFRDRDPFGARQAFVQKPFSSVDLLAKIRQVLDGGGGPAAPVS
jgi:YesN/AraC family two-component response regulator